MWPSSFMTWGMPFVLRHSMVAFQWRSVVNVIFSSLGLLSLAATLLRCSWKRLSKLLSFKPLKTLALLRQGVKPPH